MGRILVFGQTLGCLALIIQKLRHCDAKRSENAPFYVRDFIEVGR